jgi:hypothetical protein
MYALFVAFVLLLLPFEKSGSILQAYVCPPEVTDYEWVTVQPYLLPKSHYLKQKLDSIFRSARVTESHETLTKAGFYKNRRGNWSQVTVTKHPHLLGCLLKLYTDDIAGNALQMCLKRIEGVESINQCIELHGYHKYFRVPRKWIYPLPAEPRPSSGVTQHHFILVVEDMYIVNRAENEQRWRKSMTKERLNAIFVVLQECGLNDSIWPFNLPFTHDGLNSFIDTEHHHSWPVHFTLLMPYLSSKMQEHWQALINNGGPLK